MLVPATQERARQQKKKKREGKEEKREEENVTKRETEHALPNAETTRRSRKLANPFTGPLPLMTCRG